MKISAKTARNWGFLFTILTVIFILLAARSDNKIYPTLSYITGMGMIIFTTIFGYTRNAKK